jgi:hypothetical protein
VNAPALRPLATGEILDVAFSLYRRHFTTLASVALASQSPAIVVTVYVEAAGGMLQNPGLTFLSLVISSVCTAVGMGASTKIIAEAYLGRAATPGRALAAVLPHLGRIVVLTIVISMLVSFGLILLVVPGLILATGLAVSACAVVVEELTPMDAMNRSWNLTKGHRGKVFLTLLVAFALLYIVTFAATMLAGVVATLSGADTLTALLIGAAISAIFSILIYPYTYAAVTVLYYDLRVRKEGFDLEVLESQLAGA